MTLDQIKAIAAERTKGPWKYDWGNWDIENQNRKTLCCFDLGCRENITVPAHADGEFIAMAANNIDKLIAVVEAARNPALQSGESEVYKWMDALSDLRKALAALESDK